MGEREDITAASAAYLNQPLEQTAHPIRFLGLYPSCRGWAAAHRRRERESKGFHVKSQTVRFL
jgi:hypothetical protein